MLANFIRIQVVDYGSGWHFFTFLWVVGRKIFHLVLLLVWHYDGLFDYIRMFFGKGKLQELMQHWNFSRLIKHIQ